MCFVFFMWITVVWKGNSMNFGFLFHHYRYSCGYWGFCFYIAASQQHFYCLRRKSLLAAFCWLLVIKEFCQQLSIQNIIATAWASYLCFWFRFGAGGRGDGALGRPRHRGERSSFHPWGGGSPSREWLRKCAVTSEEPTASYSQVTSISCGSGSTLSAYKSLTNWC